jgi:hypothetical protein
MDQVDFNMIKFLQLLFGDHVLSIYIYTSLSIYIHLV